MRLTELEYQPDTRKMFSAFAEEPWSIWLDSCANSASSDRYDIFSAQPKFTFVCRDKITTVTDENGEFQKFTADPLALLDRALSKLHYQECCPLYTSPSPRDATLSRMPSSA